MVGLLCGDETVNVQRAVCLLLDLLYFIKREEIVRGSVGALER